MKTVDDLRQAMHRGDFVGVWMWIATGALPCSTFTTFMQERDRSMVAAAVEQVERDAARMVSKQ
jgi:hypothetical protein